jgi:hypothetical protein
MFSWLGRRGEKARQIEAEADRLVRAYGQHAHSVARRRAQEASSVRMAEEWIRIARAVACKTQALSTGTRMPMEAPTEPGRMTNEQDQPPIFDAASRLAQFEEAP